MAIAYQKQSPMILDQTKLESEIREFGTEIFNEVKNSSLSLFDPQFYTGKLMTWAMQDPEFKVQLLRFVDVIPSLTNSSAMIRLAQEYFKPVAHRIPGLLKWGLDVDPDSIAAKLAAPMIRKQIRSMAEQFIAGENPKEGLKSLRKLRKERVAFTVDLLGEAVVSEEEARGYLDRYLELLEQMQKEVPLWPESRSLVQNHIGERTPVNISVKLTALYSQGKAVASEKSVTMFADRLAEILSKAKSVNAFVYLDMEDCSLTSITIDTFKTLLGSNEFRTYDRCGLVLQAYLRRTEDDVQSLINWGKARGTPFGVRLVKGAYWDTETISAKLNGWEIPVWQQKTSSDACYEHLSVMLLENRNVIIPAFGSHNIRSLCHAVKAAELLGIENTEFELQFLYGMAEPIKKAFVDRGYLVRDYVPIGELLPGMGYLVRRLLENTSNEGFLRQSFHEHERPEVLLEKPQTRVIDSGAAHINTNYRKSFSNVPFTDFTVENNRTRFKAAIEKNISTLRETPHVVAPIVEGKAQETKKALPSRSPQDQTLTLATVGLADVELAETTVSRLKQFFPIWRDTPVETRAEVLFRAAELMEKQRAELSAIIILEAGKQWIEADADVAEAIDFLHYYAHEAKHLFERRQLGNNAGERNLYFYEPRGVTLVISPWNFPLAIPCGMFAAALVTGNCAILKPAEQTSLIASKLFEIFLEAGLPPQAASFLPGVGEEVGAHLVKHKEISTIVFTGSKDVGLEINKQAALTSYGAEHVKRVIIEMGGKNAIIVDDSADFDEAIKGVIQSAFGYQGQKCSACSRVIVVGDVYEKFAERLREATRSIVVGPASDPATLVGPVIDEEAYNRIQKMIELGKADCTVLAEGLLPEKREKAPHYVRPTVFSDIPAGHPIVTREIFGPVLALMKADTFEQAVKIAIDHEYALTGAVFSRSPKNISYALEEFRVGNLYLNRGSTGALVYRQPFGGSKMSGVGSKAGGPDYLLQFVVPRVVTENTMRRGFAPE